MRGDIDVAATFTPGESAAKIMQILLESKKYKSDKARYLNFDGSEMQW